MTYVSMIDEVTGRYALFLENGTAGDPDDPNSVRNAPLNNPTAHLSKIRFHSDFDYYLVASGPTSVVVNHATVPTAATVISTAPSITRYGQIVKTHINLVAHGLPYVPAYMVVSNGCLIGQSSLIQAGPSGGRRISPYANSTHIRLLDVGISSASDLPGFAKTYEVIVFRQPIADSPHLFDWDPVTGALILGKGKFRGSLKALRRTLIADASPFDVPMGRTSDIRNGVSRSVLADGTVYTMPAYTGSFAGSPSIQCTVE